jgi:hypothetical protein
MSEKTIYRVSFKTEERSYSLLARRVRESEYFGFIEISGIIFDDANRLIISQEEESLRQEFAHIESISVPHQFMRRIDKLSRDTDIGTSHLKIVETEKE